MPTESQDPKPGSPTIETLEKEVIRLQTEYYSDRKWLFRFFFFFLAIAAFVISVLYGLTTDEIGTKIKEAISGTAMKRASESIQGILKRMTFISQTSDSIYRSLLNNNGYYITTGSTDPENTQWHKYTGTVKDAIMLEVNTEQYNFSSTPIYLTTLYGDSRHFATTGITSIYNPNPKGFTIYIKATVPVDDLLAEAKQSKWYVRWVALTPQTDTRK